MLNTQAEIIRLMGCVTMSIMTFCELKWEQAYFSKPVAYFLSFFSEFEHLVKSFANSLPADELYRRNLQEMPSLRILSFLRLLIEIEIRTREEGYKPFPIYDEDTLEFCLEMVRGMYMDAGIIQVKALSNALGIPLRVEGADTSLQSGVLNVKQRYFLPGSELVRSSESCSTKSNSAEALEQRMDSIPTERTGVSPTGSLLSSDGIPSIGLPTMTLFISSRL